MKVRLEITDEDGTTHVNVEFTGDEWQKCLVSFIESFTGKKVQASGSSSASVANSNANSNTSCQQTVSQPSQQVFSQSNQQQSPQFFPMSAMPAQPVMQLPVQPQFFPAQQPLVYQYPQQYPQYQSVMPPAHFNYYQPPFIQNGVQSPFPNPQPVNQCTPVNNTPPQSQGMQEQPVSSARKTPSFQERIGDTNLTINERLELFLKYEYPRIWFSSQDIQQHYERIYGPIKLSTVSTYLSRMYSKNMLDRKGNRTQREYMYICDEPAELQAYQFPHQSMI